MNMDDPTVGVAGAAEKADFWRGHFARWKKSGLSQNEYCRQSHISAGQFCYWKKKHHQSEIKIHRSKQESPLTFVPVQQDFHRHFEQENSFSGLTVFLENGVRISLEKNFCGETLEKVVALFGDGK